MGFALQNDNLLAWAKSDDEFHRLLVASCGNGRIAESLKQLWTIASCPDALPQTAATPIKSVQEHELIVDAIRKGLPLEAHNHARAHRAHARDMHLPLLERFGMKHL